MDKLEAEFYYFKAIAEEKNYELEKFKKMSFDLANMIEKKMGIKNLFPKDYILITYQNYLREGKSPQNSYAQTAMQICNDWESINRKID